MAKSSGGAGRSSSASRPVESLGDMRIKITAIPGVEKVELYQSKDTGYVELSNIRVEEGARGQGIGDQAMRSLTSWADRAGVTLELTPEAYELIGPGLKQMRGYKAATTRLEKWYSSYGFKVNRGRARDFTTRSYMIRTPKNG